MSNRTYALMSLPYPVMLTETGRRTEAVQAAIVTEISTNGPPLRTLMGTGT